MCFAVDPTNIIHNGELNSLQQSKSTLVNVPMKICIQVWLWLYANVYKTMIIRATFKKIDFLGIGD